MELTAAQIRDLLELHAPGTCGFVRESYKSDVQIPAEVLPSGYSDNHSLGNVLYFLVTREASVHLHRIRSDQMYHHYQGDPLDVLLLYTDGRHELRVVGPDLASGMRPQLLIPGGTFHAARITNDFGFALLGTSVWLRAEPADVEIGDRAVLIKSHPAAQSQIIEFCK
jgi:predicted cupin superfamily sugar epimerase